VWVGALGTYDSHAPAAGLDATAGTAVNSALRRSTVSVTPGQSSYFLVSARSANFEGTLGAGTASARPGYAVTDLCTTIGRHEPPGWDLFKCGQDFTVQNARGEPFSLRNLRGRPVVLDFSAFWCAPCYLQADNLESFYQAYVDRGVEILSVVMDEESTSSDWNGRPAAAECRVWEVRSPLCILTDPPNGICTVGGGPCTNNSQCPDPLDHTFDCVADTIVCSGTPCSGSIVQRAWPRYNAHNALPTNVVLDQGFRVAFTDAGFDGSAISTLLDTLVGATDQCLH
jgi:thiol-disulfide isomerase/thioredoxin